MLELSSMLAFAGQEGSCIPPSDAHVHVTDTLDASGQFILLHYAFAALQRECPVLWLGSGADGSVHVSHIARKAVCRSYSSQGINMSLYTQYFHYIDLASQMRDGPIFPAALKWVRGVLPLSDQSRALVMVSDLSSLLWSTPGPSDAVVGQSIQWLRALRAWCAMHNGSLITLMHADACSIVSHAGVLDPTDEALLRYMLRTADLWVSVNELPSGRAADCDGELAVHALTRPAAATTCTDASSPLLTFLLERYMPASEECLYRILPDGTGPKREDGTRALVRVWARGTGLL